MRQRRSQWLVVAVLVALVATPAALAAGKGGDVADVLFDGSSAHWRVLGQHEAAVLTVATPWGVTERVYGAGEDPSFSLDEVAPDDPNGAYTWQVRVQPVVSAEVRKELARARATGDEEIVRGLARRGLLPQGPFVQSGSFVVVDGLIVAPGDVEEEAGAKGGGARAAATSGVEVVTAADVVYNDDVIITRSLCVGFDCIDGENFGFDTIRLKENNTRIKFEDTSSSAGFPTTDWQLTANDSASGGLNKFSIEDVTGARVPFTVVGGASTNSIYVDSTGRVGFRTATPVLDLHVSTTNTPGIRLEQTSAGGFTAQTWDIAGNEANFFVRDVTGGSRLPLRIRPGAPTSSLDISAAGNVGIGTTSAQERLHLSDTTSTNGAKIFFQADSLDNTIGHRLGVRGDDQPLDLQIEALRNFIMLVDDDNDSTNASLVVSKDGDPNAVIFHVKEDSTAGFFRSTASHPIHVGTDSTNGNGAHVTAGGAWVNGSSRASKKEIAELELEAALAALEELNPVTFRYLGEPTEEYVGFIAEDVPEMVAQGDRTTLGAMDIVAVLTRVVQEQQQAIAELRAELEAQKMVRQPAD